MPIARGSDWKAAATAPRDGTRFLALVGASEQGIAEVDVVCWGMTRHMGEACWSSVDSPSCPVIYSDRELAGWLPMPATSPDVPRGGADLFDYEADGSGI